MHSPGSAPRSLPSGQGSAGIHSHGALRLGICQPLHSTQKPSCEISPLPHSSQTLLPVSPSHFGTVPHGQGMHSLEPGVCECVPTGHSWHSSSLVENVPAGQGSQIPGPLPWTYPSSQGGAASQMHSSWLAMLQKGHASQTPSELVMLLVGQGLHSWLPVSVGRAGSWPHGQRLHELLPFLGAMVPAGQGSQGARLPPTEK